MTEVVSLILDALDDMEKGSRNRVMITAGGNEVELPFDSALAESLSTLWQKLGIEDIEDK
ncbi:MAG TPA: hypothetical protein VHK86_00845 [Nitrososphaera sp.]|jgi:hypothetical protein|nr:hypothetical protein [Nitrososphaera sp.]HEX2615332.1 hypothetical protein [Nitrososphaera sp.]